MKAIFKINNPDELDASMTITMSLKQWKELRDQLPSKWPAWELSSKIGDLVRQAEKTFYSTESAD